MVVVMSNLFESCTPKSSQSIEEKSGNNTTLSNKYTGKQKKMTIFRCHDLYKFQDVNYLERSYSPETQDTELAKAWVLVNEKYGVKLLQHNDSGVISVIVSERQIDIEYKRRKQKHDITALSVFSLFSFSNKKHTYVGIELTEEIWNSVDYKPDFLYFIYVLRGDTVEAVHRFQTTGNACFGDFDGDFDLDCLYRPMQTKRIAETDTLLLQSFKGGIIQKRKEYLVTCFRAAQIPKIVGTDFTGIVPDSVLFEASNWFQYPPK
jgi:hypothetical protein